MDLAAWSIETSSAKVKQMPFSVGNLLEICSSDKIYGSMNKKDTPWQYLTSRNVINNKWPHAFHIRDKIQPKSPM